MENAELGFPSNWPWMSLPCICVGPACHQQSAVKEPTYVLHVCVRLCQNIANPQSRERWNPVWTRQSVNPISPAERGGGKEGQQEALTQLITHWQLRSLEGATFVSLSLYDTVCLVILDKLTGLHDSSLKRKLDQLDICVRQAVNYKKTI